MLPIHTAAQVANSTAASSNAITWAGAVAIAIVVAAICWMNRNNI